MEIEIKNVIMFNCKSDCKTKKQASAREKALDWEQKLLATQGFIKDQNVWIYDVKIDGQKGEKEEQFMHTIECGRENEEVLVFIHGYGGTGAYMWKIMAQLAANFHVYAIDQYGQGLSARPDFKLKRKNYHETVDFFCNAIEDWRKGVKLEKPFSLMGHSFGGYTALQYVKTHQPNLKHLYLLSPAGMTTVDETKVDSTLKNNYKMGFFKRKFVKTVMWLIQDKQYTPF
jgi:cardiolipin-specific phospholipase